MIINAEASKQQLQKKLRPSESISEPSHSNNKHNSLLYNIFITFRTYVVDCFDSQVWAILIFLLTILTLFLDDFRIWLMPLRYDYSVACIMLAIFSLFSMEFVLNCALRYNYLLQFFFWMDLFCLLSLICDIPWFFNPLMGLNSYNPNENQSAASNINQTNHYSTVINRSSRIIRFVRLIRLVRIAKLFELAAVYTHKYVNPSTSSSGGAANPNNKPSQVGQHLSEQTTRKVVILVLLMLFSLPLLQPHESNSALQYSLRELSLLSDPSAFANNTSAASWNYASRVSEISFLMNYYGNVLYLNITSPDPLMQYTFIDPSLGDYRPTEVRAVDYDNVEAFFSIRWDQQRRGLYNIIMTIVVLCLLIIGAILFNRNNHRMVIVPIERMMATIVALQQNPLAKASLHAENGAAGTNPFSADAAGNNHMLRDPSSETGMLERTLEKLTSLLQVGFGDAGSKMIQKCMQLNASGDLDPLVDGTKMQAIFGFCDIRRFTDATECLKEDVMMYVNEIAAIVHGQVSNCDGNPNKNIGDAFLLVWRLPVETEELQAISDANQLHQSQASSASINQLNSNGVSLQNLAALKRVDAKLSLQVSSLADKALVSFLRVIAEIHASEELKKYSENPLIKKQFSDFTVTLGFGLHVGWAIEGPIGSRYKIDASYLSPHVNLAESLEGTTKLYGVKLLMSGEFACLLSPYCKQFIRLVDCIKIQGKENKMELWTFDIQQKALDDITNTNTQQNNEEGKSDPNSPMVGINSVLHIGRSVPISSSLAHHFVRNSRLSALQFGMSGQFFECHRLGISSYMAGDWSKAKTYLTEALAHKPNDQPTKVILNYIKEFNFTAPESWKGYREL
jgi:class 3 adenylate cyclase